MKIAFYYITRGGQKVYAYTGCSYAYKTKEELLEQIKEHGRGYGKGVHKKFEDFTAKELQNEIATEIAYSLNLPNDVGTMFQKYYGIDLYNIHKSDCIFHPRRYIKIFTNQELTALKDGKHRNYWHFLCGWVHMCPRVATINFKKIKQSLQDEKGVYGIYDGFEDNDRYWCFKITDVLHKIFGDKQKFYFSKWNRVLHPRTTNINIGKV